VAYHGERPWEEVFARHRVDIAFVATPDHLHTAPTLAALAHGAHVMVEKPLALRLEDADAILRAASDRGLVVGVDMHKRYDPCHRFLFQELVPRIGQPLYGRAVLEEPLEVSTQTFQWAAQSNPFSYVGVHWTDLFGHYLGLVPASLHAVGQKELLARWNREGGDRAIDAFDALEVAVDYTNGMRVYYVNNWINPREFEGPVNQEMEIVGTRGKIEFDQQYRGLRATIAGLGSRTFNPHFTMDVPRPGQPGEPPAHDGYGKDSIVAIVERALEVKLGLASRDELRGTYPDVESARATVGLLEAAAVVAERNHASLEAGEGTPFTARFSAVGIELMGPGGSQPLYRGRPY
jgi:predicted dehydrogenase